MTKQDYTWFQQEILDGLTIEIEENFQILEFHTLNLVKVQRSRTNLKNIISGGVRAEDIPSDREV